ncbi:MAG TPA: DUF3667 domain-containing protein [Dinghuibacter sp.]|uniref:DUF3667 domain-containing protein n=1 Tax=Dinghuibacter sp. TaxID=2024697 RepID=UPI002D098AD0|nr:DUF3667 domain-containing protein [Dinghuibacter sp.]HTJ11332.1 DUF3667 domain-containing protein [Dinghuibacter sp.]
MKGSHLRHDKTCLNCGFTVEERYCSRCGQENADPRESIGHLIGHFFSDITHYDSKFITSLRDLLFKPGFLTREYNAGRRASYLNPIRMYVFISALFFIVLFGGSEEAPPLAPELHPAAANAFSQRIADSLREAAPVNDSIRASVYRSLASRLDTARNAADTAESWGFHLGANDNEFATDMEIVENRYQRISQYDSIQAARPDSTRESGFARWATHRMIHIRQRHPGKGVVTIRENIGQNIPKLMFVLLPLFAWFVGWFYNHQRYIYTQHVIFSLHFHAFVFIAFLLGLLILKIPTDSQWLALILLCIPLVLIFTYLAFALSRTYAEVLWLSFIKSLALCLMYLLVLLLALVGVGIYDFMTA